MNAVFAILFLLSAVGTLFMGVDAFLPALLDGVDKAVTVGIQLFAVYGVWATLAEVATRCHLTDGLAKLFLPLTKRVFGIKDEKARQELALNLSCNLLGVGGAATPFGVRCMGRLEQEGNERAQKLLFILNATSLQILPTTVIGLRASGGSLHPADIFLPSLLTSLLCTAVGLTLYGLGVSMKGKFTQRIARRKV